MLLDDRRQTTDDRRQLTVDSQTAREQRRGSSRVIAAKLNIFVRRCSEINGVLTSKGNLSVMNSLNYRN